MANEQINFILLTINDSNSDLEIEHIKDKIFIRYVIFYNLDNLITEFIEEQEHNSMTVDNSMKNSVMYKKKAADCMIERSQWHNDFFSIILIIEF